MQWCGGIKQHKIEIFIKCLLQCSTLIKRTSLLSSTADVCVTFPPLVFRLRVIECACPSITCLVIYISWYQVCISLHKSS